MITLVKGMPEYTIVRNREACRKYRLKNLYWVKIKNRKACERYYRRKNNVLIKDKLPNETDEQRRRRKKAEAAKRYYRKHWQTERARKERSRQKRKERLQNTDHSPLLYKLAPHCLICHSIQKLQVDHRIPLARGGKHTLNNLCTLCKSCNSRKKDKTFYELLK